MRRIGWFSILPVAIFVALPARAQDCGMERGVVVTQSERNPTIDILKAEDGKPAAMFVVANKFAVNTDGSPRSYHPLDPEGKKYALNNVCHASVRVFDDGKSVSCYDKRQQPRYYEIFKDFIAEQDAFGAKDEGYDPTKDPEYSVGKDFGLGLDEPREERDEAPAPPVELSLAERKLGSDYACYRCRAKSCSVCFTRNIIKLSKSPCLRDKGKYAGYFVNLVSIDPIARNEPDPENNDGANQDDRSCRQPIRIDAEKLPGIVLPGGRLDPLGEVYAAKKGDIAIAYNVQTRRWAFAVVGDSGPVTDFGEGSMAANRILKYGYAEERPRPRVYSDAASLHISNKVALLLIPGSAATLSGDYSPKTVARVAKEAFVKWGGKELPQARERFRNCLKQLPASFKGDF